MSKHESMSRQHDTAVPVTPAPFDHLIDSVVEIARKIMLQIKLKQVHSNNNPFPTRRRHANDVVIIARDQAVPVILALMYKINACSSFDMRACWSGPVQPSQPSVFPKRPQTTAYSVGNFSSK